MITKAVEAKNSGYKGGDTDPPSVGACKNDNDEDKEQNTFAFEIPH